MRPEPLPLTLISAAAISLALAALGAAAAPTPEPKLVFEDRFEGKLGPGWTWLREDPKAWRIGKKALEIRVQPGVAEDVKDALLRPAPDRTKGRFAIDFTVTNTKKPTHQYEQAGITWYTDGKPVFKLVHEFIDGKLYIIPGKVPMDGEKVQLRVVVSPEGFEAQFRADPKGEFKTAASGKLPEPKKDQVSLQCYQGPPDAEHWIRFEDFRILELPSGTGKQG